MRNRSTGSNPFSFSEYSHLSVIEKQNSIEILKKRVKLIDELKKSSDFVEFKSYDSNQILHWTYTFDELSETSLEIEWVTRSKDLEKIAMDSNLLVVKRKSQPSITLERLNFSLTSELLVFARTFSR